MSSLVPKTFGQIYNSCCQDSKIRTRAHVLDEKCLKINADLLEKNDWTPVISAMKHCFDLHSIVIYSQHLRKRKKTNPIRSRESLQSSNEPDVFKESVLKPLIGIIAKYISTSEILYSLHLEGLQLQNNYFSLLNCSLNQQTNLQHLALPYSLLDEEQVICLCRTVKCNVGIRTLDLTGCNIKITAAKEIASLIRSQKLVRYGEIWKQSLRYRIPDPDVVPGIRRLTLNDNTQLGDEGFKVIVHELVDDLFIAAIDFQKCGITDVSNKYALELININPVIKILDLRKNFISQSLVENIISRLQDGNSNETKTYKWLDSTAASQSNVMTSVQKNKKLPNDRTYSVPNINISHKVESRTLPNNKNTAIKRPKEFHSETEAKIGADLKPYYKINELQKTKDFLHRVSSKLSEERVRRVAVEKEHKQCAKKLEGIRSCCEQHSKNNQIETGSSKSTKITNKSLKPVALLVQQKKTKKKQNEKQTKQNKNSNSTKQNKRKVKQIIDERKSKDTSLIVNELIKSAKMFLLVPKDSSVKC